MLDLKTMQDWMLQRRFRAVPGVIDVTGWGGKSKTYELQVDFNKLVANGLTLPQLLQAVGNSNVNVGGNTVNIGQQSAVVRGVGLIRSIDDLANTMVSQTNGNPVLVKDVATVTVGQKPRLGIAGIDDDDDIVQGIVLMRRGEQSSPTIKRVQQLVKPINKSSILPPGVHIERIYDRRDLIDLTTHTVLHNMVVGILLIVLLQWIFLGDLRSALIVGATIPFALFFAVIILVLRGESANLLSVGAIDFGLIVDATVIMVEAIFRRLTQTTPMSEAERAHVVRDAVRHEEPRHPQRRGRRVALDLLCRRDHHRGLPAAVHALRRRGQHLRADGADLCLRAGRRPACDLHRHAGAVRDHPAGACRGDRDQGDADAASDLHAGAELGGRQPRHHARRRGRPCADDRRARPAAWPRIPAQAGGGQSLDPRHVAADHLAAGRQLLRQRDAQGDPRPA